MLRNYSELLSWPYLNPDFTIELEYYNSTNRIDRKYVNMPGIRYNLTLSNGDSAYQGGYRCSIRSVTPWENVSYMFSQPNYYSRYMPKVVQTDGVMYTSWNASFGFFDMRHLLQNHGPGPLATAAPGARRSPLRPRGCGPCSGPGSVAGRRGRIREPAPRQSEAMSAGSPR